MAGFKKEGGSLLRFLALGVVNTAIDFGLMNLLTHFGRLPLVWAQAISFTAAVINSYTFSRVWVYPQGRSGKIEAQAPKFLLVNLAGLALRSLLIPPINSAIYNYLRANMASPAAAWSKNLALVLVLPGVLLLNFFLNRYWTFRSPATGGSA